MALAPRFLRLISCFLLLLFNTNLIAQESVEAPRFSNIHSIGDWSLSASAGQMYHPDAYARFSGGLDLSFYLGKYVSLNANFAFGPGFYQFGLGVIGIPLILLFRSDLASLGSNFTELLIGIGLMILSFENMNFHIPLSPQFEISPYLSLLRIKEIKGGYGSLGSETNVNLVLGTRLNIFLSKRFIMAPYFETNRDWNPGGKWGLNGGLQAGFYFPGVGKSSY